MVAGFRLRSECTTSNWKDPIVLELTVNSMSCGHCVSAVTKALQQLDPQAKVAIDLATHKVRVETGAARERVVAALVDAGYEPA
jgi:copper chaperone